MLQVDDRLMFASDLTHTLFFHAIFCLQRFFWGGEDADHHVIDQLSYVRSKTAQQQISCPLIYTVEDFMVGLSVSSNGKGTNSGGTSSCQSGISYLWITAQLMVIDSFANHFDCWLFDLQPTRGFPPEINFKMFI